MNRHKAMASDHQISLFKKILLFAIFQSTWVATAWMAGNGYEGIAWLPMTLWAMGMIGFAAHPVLELKTIGCISVLGFINDTVLIQNGAITLGHSVSPPWLIAIWAGFAPTLSWGYTQLQKRIVFMALLGAFFGYLSYRAGAAFGALQLTPDLSLPWIAGCWAVAFPACIWIRVWLEQQQS